MFTVRIFTKHLRTLPGWDEDRVKNISSFMSHWWQCNINIEDDVITAVCDFQSFLDPGMWLLNHRDDLTHFERIIDRIEVSTDTPVIGSGNSFHCITNPAIPGEWCKFHIGTERYGEGSRAYLNIENSKDFKEGLRLFMNQIALFTLMAKIYHDAEQATNLISEKHQYDGALRNLENMKRLATVWSSELIK